MIIYGSQYYRPPFPGKDSWKSDLIKIKELNFNTVKLWAVWSWIERKDGEYYYDDLDTIIDLCAEVGLNVVINTIPEGMPYWLSRRHSDAKYRTNDGQTIEMSGAANMPSGGSPGVCPDKQEVQLRICGFIRQVVERYAVRENVIAFDVWNEPHLEPIFDYPDQLFCYCDYSKDRFIEWLKAKYISVEILNHSWMRAYTSWEDILPPVRYGTYPDMIDWRHFWLENLGVWLDARVQVARDAAIGKTVMTHVPFSGYIGGSGDGGLGYHLGDEFILASKVDKFGLTSFPKWLMGNDFVQHLINIELVASSAIDKEFWQSELQAGAGKWEAEGRAVARDDEIRLWNWSAIAGGAKGVMYWQWRPEPSGMEALGFGLTTLSGDLSPRTNVASQCAQVFNRLAGFDDARRVRAINGIFVSRTTDLWWHSAYKGETLYARSLYGAYRATFDAGIPVRMVHADHLSNALKEGLKVLYVPAAVALSNQELDGMRDFVKGGGILVAEACLGLFDEYGVLRENVSFIEEVFGLSGQEVDHDESVTIQPLPGMDASDRPMTFSGCYYRQDFHNIQSGVEILGQFEDGRPAVFKNSFGQGWAIQVGSFPAMAVSKDENAASARFITQWMNPSGYNQFLELNTGEKVLIRLHQHKDHLFLCAVNYCESEQPVRVLFDRPYRFLEQQAQASFDEVGYSLSMKVTGRDGLLIELVDA